MIVDRGFGRPYLDSIRDTSAVEPAVVVDVSEPAGLVPFIIAAPGPRSCRCARRWTRAAAERACA